MSFTLIYTFRALKDLERLPPGARRRVLSALGRLSAEEDPGRSVRRLPGSPLSSIRAGTYRVILEIRRETINILVIRDRPRRNMYHDMR